MAPSIEKFKINKPNLTTFKYKFEQKILIINLKASPTTKAHRNSELPHLIP